MRESSIERSCCDYAKSRGCWPVKVQSGITGDPDRLFILPDHWCWPVEFKKPGGRLSPRQKVRHAELDALGIHVAVIYDRLTFVTLLDLFLERL